MKFFLSLLLSILFLILACEKKTQKPETPELTTQVTTSDEPLDRSVFGEVLNAENTPIVQIDSKYGIVPANRDDLVVNTNGTGTASATTSGNFSVTSGTASGNFATIASKNGVIYRPGEGIEARFTAAFTTGGAATSTQFAGMTNVTDQIAFGYNNTTFGIEHSYGGVAQIATITVTGTTGGTRSVQLNGLTDAALSVTAGSISSVASTLTTALNNSATFSSLWSFQQTAADTIICVAKQKGLRSGTYSVSGTVGSIAGSTVAGGSGTTDFVVQASWNIATNPFTGFDPTMLNIYRITFGYLGVANIVYSVYNPNIGKYVPVHQLEWANSQTFSHTSTPDFSIGIGAQSSGAITARIVQSASMYLAMQGKLIPTNISFSTGDTKTVGTTLLPIVSISNRITNNVTSNQKPNHGKINLAAISVSNAGTANSLISVRKNYDISPATPTYVNQDNSLALSDILAITFTTTGIEVSSFVVPASTFALIPYTNLGVTLLPGEILTVAAQTTAGTATVTSTINWLEEH